MVPLNVSLGGGLTFTRGVIHRRMTEQFIWIPIILSASLTVDSLLLLRGTNTLDFNVDTHKSESRNGPFSSMEFLVLVLTKV